ncbi:transposase, MuDR, MULE transposase domain protein [Tanacetum coccineum]
MACSVSHTYDEIKSMVEKQIQEDRGRQLAIMNLGHQFDNAITAKDELRKAYEECRDIPLVQRALIENFLKIESELDQQMQNALFGKAAKLEKQIRDKNKWLQQLYKHDNQGFIYSVDENIAFRHIDSNLNIISLTPVASSEGVWCIAFGENSMLLLWNPSIKKSVGVSVPNYTFQPDSPKMIFGFCIRPVTLEPTLLKINYPLYSDDPWYMSVSTLSSRTWYNLDYDCLPRESVRIIWAGQAVIDGKIFWIGSERTPLYKSKPMISKEYKKETEVKVGKIFDNKEALVLAIRLKALDERYQFLSERSPEKYLVKCFHLKECDWKIHATLWREGGDAARLKGQYKGTNLVVVGMDGNNQIVPIAFDRHAAIALAVLNEFPLAFHAVCCRHLMMNLSLKRNKTKGLFWKICKAYTPEEFLTEMSNLHDVQPDAYHKLIELPVLKLAEMYRAMVQEWYFKRRELIDNMTSEITDWVANKVNKKRMKSATWLVYGVNHYQYQVSDGRYNREVDFQTRTCQCRK